MFFVYASIFYDRHDIGDMRIAFVKVICTLTDLLSDISDRICQFCVTVFQTQVFQLFIRNIYFLKTIIIRYVKLYLFLPAFSAVFRMKSPESKTAFPSGAKGEPMLSKAIKRLSPGRAMVSA